VKQKLKMKKIFCKSYTSKETCIQNIGSLLSGFIPNTTNKKKNNQRVMTLNRHFSKKDTQMLNKHMRRCLTSLAMREVQTESTSCIFTLTRMAT
jgi:hypothetical protein